jgi:pimeloyl-ACP methyl ester carboxylesterase
MLEAVHADAKIANISYNVYAALVEMVEKAGYGPCTDDFTLAENMSLPARPECFSFFYDWRQDNVGNAIRLGQFLEDARGAVLERRSELETPSARPVKFDLIAHSMGGLLTRYFLRYGPHDVLSQDDPLVAWGGAEHLGRVVLISTPNFGAMKVLKELITGQRFPMVKFEAAMLATWVSAYQLFPRQTHRLWLDDAGYPAELEFASGKFWRDNKWGGFADGQDKYLQWLFPSAATPVERQDLLESFMDAAFDRAARLARALDKHPESEPPVPLILFAADAEPTLARAVVAEKKGTIRLKFGVKKPELRSPGDGSVTRASALADERLAGAPADRFSSPVAWSQKIFLTDKHRTLLGNATFQNNLLHILLETDSPSTTQ